MKKLLCLFLTVLLLLPAIALGEEVVNVYNWEDYICEDALTLFTQETGIKVNYMRFTTNEDMMVQVRTNPSAFDVVFPSEYCVERMISENLLEEINFENIPNFSNIRADLLNPDYDANNAHSVPYMWGTVGILYNTKLVNSPVDSWSVLWDTQYQNNVFMLDSIRDSLGITLKYLGYSMNSRNPDELEQATEKLVEQKKSGVVKAYQVDETKDKMVAGEAALSVVYSGDAEYAIELNPDLAYVVPDEGSNIWVDCMVIPKGAANKSNAEKFIDFMSRPDVAQMNCEEIGYSSPNVGAVELMGDTYTNNSVMNPSEDVVNNCEYFHDIQDFIDIYAALWNDVKNAR